MDYSKLSDFEVNLKLAHIILGKDNYDWNSDKKEVYLAGIDGGEFLPNGYFDPCNNPADAWPIISANRITIEYDAEHQCDVPVEWVTAYGIDGLKVHLVAHQPCDKALRSAMIVFLMMQESANVQDNPT